MATFATRSRTVTDIATSVRDARLAAGMSQADLASAAHLNRSWVSLFESGHSPNASLSKVLAMTNALGITIRLTYTVPDADTPVIERAPHPRHSPTAVETPHDHTEGMAPNSVTLDAGALAAARAIRERHRARADADDLARRPFDD